MRNRRQQQVLLAMRDRALQTGIISKLPTLIAELGDSVRTDLKPGQMLSLARLGQQIDGGNIFTHSIAPLVEAEDINGGFYYVGDWDAIRAMVDDLPHDPDAHSSLSRRTRRCSRSFRRRKAQRPRRGRTQSRHRPASTSHSDDCPA